jgi:putative transposase
VVDTPKVNQYKSSRRSMRMKGYDYSLEGAYFVTIVTHKRFCLFGGIINGNIYLNTYGNIAHEQWMRLQHRFLRADFSSFVIMPNHVHGIIHIVRGAGEASRLSFDQIPPQRPYGFPLVNPGALGIIVRAFKASVTYRINAIRGTINPPIWQRNYYDHIVRNEQELNQI